MSRNGNKRCGPAVRWKHDRHSSTAGSSMAFVGVCDQQVRNADVGFARTSELAFCEILNLDVITSFDEVAVVKPTGEPFSPVAGERCNQS